MAKALDDIARSVGKIRDSVEGEPDLPWTQAAMRDHHHRRRALPLVALTAIGLLLIGAWRIYVRRTTPLKLPLLFRRIAGLAGWLLRARHRASQS